MSDDLAAVAIARLEVRFDSLEAGQAKILTGVSNLRNSDVEMRVRIARLEGELDRRPTYKEFILWGAGAMTAMIAVAELFIHVVL